MPRMSTMQPWTVTLGAKSCSRRMVAALRKFIVTIEVPNTGMP